MFKKCGKIMEKHVGQSSALQEIDRWSSCKFSTAGKHSVISKGATVLRLVVYPVRSHRIVGIEFGLFPGAIRGIHFELQRPKYFVNLYIV